MNLKVRFKNPVFIARFLLAVLTPVLAYAGLTAQDLTTWSALGDLLMSAISNPYVLSLVVVSVWNALNDPTTKGLKDSGQALTYRDPNKARGNANGRQRNHCTFVIPWSNHCGGNTYDEAERNHCQIKHKF